MNQIDELKKQHERLKTKIKNRLQEFSYLWKKQEPIPIFKEAVFCLLTPQSKARICWRAVKSLEESGLLWGGKAEEIAQHLIGVRFKNNKAKYIVELREKYWRGGKFLIMEKIKALPPAQAREWLVRNVKGMGYKEASHFLRNIGFSFDLAILDRHILKNLLLFGAIDHIPKNLSRKNYMEIERKMKEFSEKIKIPMGELDLLFWAREAGEIFK